MQSSFSKSKCPRFCTVDAGLRLDNVIFPFCSNAESCCQTEQVHAGASTGGKWTQLASSLAQGGKEFPPQGGKNSTFKGGRIPPQIYGSHIIYKSFLAHGSHLQLGVRSPHVSDIIFVVLYLTARCSDREVVIGL